MATSGDSGMEGVDWRGILGAPWELLSCSGALPKAGLWGFSAGLGVTLRGRLRDT